jgi:uncharacterized membrane protein YfhO
VSVDVDARRPGHLVLADTYYPGWKAKVDGREQPIRAANASFRAVRVPAGRHVVEFAYEPLSFRAGAAISALSVLGIAAGLALPAVVRRRRRRAIGPD